MDNIFTCKGKLLADYLIAHGSKLKKIDRNNGDFTFIFEYDESIEKNIEQWEADMKKCMF